MAIRIILPKIAADMSRDETPLPLFFLAGPVRGGGEWQSDMCAILECLLEDCYVAVPCRWEKKDMDPKRLAKGVRGPYEDQNAWERSYLDQAGERRPGCIIFWLAYENVEQPHPGPEPYAMDTRGELGEWRGRMRNHYPMRFPRPHVVVGAEPKFFGLSQIQRNFNRALGYSFPIYESMVDMADAAVEMAFRQD